MNALVFIVRCHQDVNENRNTTICWMRSMTTTVVWLSLLTWGRLTAADGFITFINTLIDRQEFGKSALLRIFFSAIDCCTCCIDKSRSTSITSCRIHHAHHGCRSLLAFEKLAHGFFTASLVYTFRSTYTICKTIMTADEDEPWFYLTWQNHRKALGQFLSQWCSGSFEAGRKYAFVCHFPHPRAFRKYPSSIHRYVVRADS